MSLRVGCRHWVGGSWVNAYDPGATPGTGLSRDYPLVLRALFSRPLLRLLGLRNYTAEVSGAAMARMVLDPGLEGVTGKYFHVHEELRSSKESYDEEKARDLWETSLMLCGGVAEVVSGRPLPFMG